MHQSWRICRTQIKPKFEHVPVTLAAYTWSPGAWGTQASQDNPFVSQASHDSPFVGISLVVRSITKKNVWKYQRKTPHTLTSTCTRASNILHTRACAYIQTRKYAHPYTQTKQKETSNIQFVFLFHLPLRLILSKVAQMQKNKHRTFSLICECWL